MILKDKTNRYRHYKGGIYYKLGEASIVGRIFLSGIKNNIIKMFPGKMEDTLEDVNIYMTSEGGIYVHIINATKKRDYKAVYIVYISEDKPELRWVRLKVDFEGFTEVNGEKVKRFTLANT